MALNITEDFVWYIWCEIYKIGTLFQKVAV